MATKAVWGTYRKEKLEKRKRRIRKAKAAVTPGRTRTLRAA